MLLQEWKENSTRWWADRVGNLSPAAGYYDIGRETEKARAFLRDQGLAVLALKEMKRSIPVWRGRGIPLTHETRNRITHFFYSLQRPFASQNYPNQCVLPELRTKQLELLRLMRSLASRQEFGLRLGQPNVEVSFATLPRPGYAEHFYPDSTASAIVAYLECYDEVYEYVMRRNAGWATGTDLGFEWGRVRGKMRPNHQVGRFNLSRFLDTR